jgi:hypothetical protein
MLPWTVSYMMNNVFPNMSNTARRRMLGKFIFGDVM